MLPALPLVLEKRNLIYPRRDLLPRLKAAGGDIVLWHGEQQDWRVIAVDNDEEKDVRRLKARLMPGYAIIERQDLLQHEEGKDALDCLLNAMQVQLFPQYEDGRK